MLSQIPVAVQQTIPSERNSHEPAQLQTLSWNFNEPPFTLRGSKMLLLTIGGICVSGNWFGEPGQYFVAWAPMLKIDHDKFNAVVEAYQARLSQRNLTH